MVRDLENGSRVVRLGEGTTMVSTLMMQGEEPHIICFSNKAPEEGVFGNLTGGEVLIEFTGIAGFLSYVRAGIDVLAHWDMDEKTKAQIHEMQAQLTASLAKLMSPASDSAVFEVSTKE